jgi:hypothetical protein
MRQGQIQKLENTLWNGIEWELSEGATQMGQSLGREPDGSLLPT